MTIDPARINIDALLRFVEEIEDYVGMAAEEGAISLLDASEAGRYLRAALEGAPSHEVNGRLTSRRGQYAQPGGLVEVELDVFGPENGWGEDPPKRGPEPRLHFVRSVNEDFSFGHWLKIYAPAIGHAALTAQAKGAKPVCVVRDDTHEALCLVIDGKVVLVETWVFDRGGPIACSHGQREHDFPVDEEIETVRSDSEHAAAKRGLVSWVTCRRCEAWQDAEFPILSAVAQAYGMLALHRGEVVVAEPPADVSKLDARQAALTSAT